MTLDPRSLQNQLDTLEAIEKATARLVTQAIYDFRTSAAEIFLNEADLVADIGEDITREAMDRLGTSNIPLRLFGKIDYKRARFMFHSDYSLRQALFVDSKAEKVEGARTATIQMGQTSMLIRQRRRGVAIEEFGGLPSLIQHPSGSLLTTTIFVKYNYREIPNAKNELASIRVVTLPNGMLQDRYNPDVDNTFWLVGRNADTRGEAFRVRISLNRLKNLANWRVQHIDVGPTSSYAWAD